MTEQNSGRPSADAFVTVRNPEQARLLTDSESFKYFEPFVSREKTASETAEEVGCQLDTMLYRIKKFVSAGLLEITQLEKRAGRPIKHYRSSADAYFIPFEVTPFSDVEERFLKQTEPYNRQIARALARELQTQNWLGVRIYRERDARGEVWRESAADTTSTFDFEDPNKPTIMQTTSELILNREKAKAFEVDLHQLWQRYKEEQTEAGQRFLFQIALVPLEPD